MRKIHFLLLAVVLSTNSCVSVPKVVNKDPSCELITKNIELKIEGSDKSWIDAATERAKEDIPGMCSGGGGDIGALICIFGVYAYGTVGAASFIVSGSIVVVGNTVHWIEKKGKCSQEKLYKASEDFKSQKARMEGKPVTSISQLKK